MAKSTTSSSTARRKARRNVTVGIAHIKATFNNTIISITDKQGNVVAWHTPGKAGFKGSRKSTPFAAQVASEVAGKLAYDAGMRKVEVHLHGAGNGREGAIRALAHLLTARRALPCASKNRTTAQGKVERFREGTTHRR